MTPAVAPALPLSAPRNTDVTPGAHGWYLILVLTLAYTVSFIDRQVLNLLVGPLKAEFALDDTRLSLLQGVAFTTAYIVASPIMGRLADIGRRRSILMFGVVLWSVGTSLCGLSRSYVQLFFARAAVGGAEACLTPASWSIIADSFPPRMIPRAFSVYMMGPYLGGGLALIFGGLLLEGVGQWDLSVIPLLDGMKPWQLVFLMAGLPGMAIALLFLFVREPARRASPLAADQGRMDMVDVRRAFREQCGFYGNFYAGMSCLVILLYAFPAWMPTVLMRRFDVGAGAVGLEYGFVVLVTGSAGVLLGPWIATMLERRGHGDALMRVPLAAALALIPVSLAPSLAGSYGAVLACAGLASFLYSMPQALASSALQLVTPNRMRGVASAVYVFTVSVTGLGAAPTIVAVLTDHVFGDEARVGDSLAVTCVAAAAGAAFFLYRALKAYRRLIVTQVTDSGGIRS